MGFIDPNIEEKGIWTELVAWSEPHMSFAKPRINLLVNDQELVSVWFQAAALVAETVHFNSN